MRTIIILVVILLVVLAVALWALQRQRTNRLRARFGSEYDHTLERTGNRREAEQTLAEVADRRDQLEIRPLTPQQRESWVQQWSLVQSRFVDSPGEAVAMARQLLPSLMRERGYPSEGFDERATLLAADHPVVVGEYRAAEQAYQRHQAVGGGGASTESLRQALVHYRALFEALTDTGDTRDADPDAVDSRGALADGSPVDGSPTDGSPIHGRHADGAPVDARVVDARVKDARVNDTTIDNERGVNHR